MQANAMESAGGVEMPANGIAVERNKDDVPESCWDNNQSCVRFRARNGFPINKDVILHNKVGLVESNGIICIQLNEPGIFVANRA
jgi:hypothetical protein